MCVFVWRIDQSSPSEKSQSVYTLKKHPRPIIEKWYSNKKLIGTQSHTNAGIGIKALPLALQSSKEVHVLVHGALALTPLGPTASAFCLCCPNHRFFISFGIQVSNIQCMCLMFLSWALFPSCTTPLLGVPKACLQNSWWFLEQMIVFDFFDSFPEVLKKLYACVCWCLHHTSSCLILLLLLCIICPYGLVPVTMQDFSDLEIWQFDSLNLIHLNLIVF